MSDKNITISRELAERLTIPHAKGITDPCTIRTLQAQFHAALDELRACLDKLKELNQ